MAHRFESLEVDTDDASPYRRRRVANARSLPRQVVLLLVLAGLAGYGFWSYTDLPRRIATALAPPEPRPASGPSETARFTPEPLGQAYPEAKVHPRPLADCMGADNLIDEEVATCRFGEMPKPVHDPSAQGMVSARYLAQYKADRQREATARARPSTVVWSTLRRWDGKGAYSATWTYRDNRIDGTSVCTNLQKGSIDYRECRKGAKVHFREQCRAWSRRLGEQYSDSTQAQQQRYCSAAEVFNPLG